MSWVAHAQRVALGVAFILIASGCSTPGPLHVYSISKTGAEVQDVAPAGNDSTAPVPSYLDVSDEVTGFAYDPFTDHFFLRLNPGNRFRVVDRPARKIKREFTVREVAKAGGDLAVRPRDGHLFLVNPAAPELIETSRLGDLIRRVRLEGRSAPAHAVAYDSSQNELLVLGEDRRTVDRFRPDGAKLRSIMLERPVQASLGYDSEKGELYAPLPETRGEVGVFDGSGRLRRTITVALGNDWLDVGPHSFFRMF